MNHHSFGHSVERNDRIIRWQQPSFGKPCRVCGRVTTLEYCNTVQSEPSKYTEWTPRCQAHS